MKGRVMRFRLIVSSFFACVALAATGCSSSSTAPPPPVNPHPNLYVTLCSGTHFIDVFDPPFSNTSTPAVTVPYPAGATCGLSLALLANNQIAVGTNGVGWYVYALPLTNTSAPTLHLATPAFVGGLSQDSGGDVLASDTSNSNILLFPPPLTAASIATVTFASSSRPYIQQMNSAGQLFVGNCSSATITVFTPPFTNATTPTATLTPAGGACTEGIGLDANGNLYAGNFSSPYNVYIYNPPYSNASLPVTTIAGGPSGTTQVGGIAFDASGNVYIANYGGNTITSFATPLTGASALRFSIPTEPQPAQILFGP
jgi:hypothetical protein